MKDNRIELADVVRRFKDDYLTRFGHLMMPSQKKALADIAACMTAEMNSCRATTTTSSPRCRKRYDLSSCPTRSSSTPCS
jgi:hypothetical protein